MITNNSFTIRPMIRTELDLAIDWAAKEGWNPGIYDADSFWSVDPEGFFIGLENNKPVATVSAVKYDAGFGFIGFFIVKAEYRSQGFGLLMGRKALDYLKGCNVGIDGVVEQQENYKRFGFQIAYQNIRFETHGTRSQVMVENLVPIQKVRLTDLLEYDTRHFPTQRATFVRNWIKQPQATTLAYLEKGKMTGYGMIRKCRNGFKIGPLFADDYEIAQTILSGLLSRIRTSEPVFLDVPEINADGLLLAENYNMRRVFETVRMYSKEKPRIDINHVFGVTSFELG